MAAGILIVALTAILAIDLVPQRPLEVQAGQLADSRHRGRRGRSNTRVPSRPQAASDAAGAAVPFQYTYTTENAIAIAQAQQVALRAPRPPASTPTFSADLPADDPGHSPRERRLRPELCRRRPNTLKGLDPSRWAAVRSEAARVLDATRTD